jgi:hypothetical protein
MPPQHQRPDLLIVLDIKEGLTYDFKTSVLKCGPGRLEPRSMPPQHQRPDLLIVLGIKEGLTHDFKTSVLKCGPGRT